MRLFFALQASILALGAAACTLGSDQTESIGDTRAAVSIGQVCGSSSTFGCITSIDGRQAYVGDTVTLHGFFDPVGYGTQVSVSGNAVTVTCASFTECSFVAPPMPAGAVPFAPVQIEVTVDDHPIAYYPYVGPIISINYKTPTITGITPAIGTTLGGNAVTVTGRGLTNGDARFYFGSTQAPQYSCSGNTECSVLAPPGAGNVLVKATTSAGPSTTQPYSYAYLPAPSSIAILGGASALWTSAKYTGQVVLNEPAQAGGTKVTVTFPAGFTPASETVTIASGSVGTFAFTAPSAITSAGPVVFVASANGATVESRAIPFFSGNAFLSVEDTTSAQGPDFTYGDVGVASVYLRAPVSAASQVALRASNAGLFAIGAPSMSDNGTLVSFPLSADSTSHRGSGVLTATDGAVTASENVTVFPPPPPGGGGGCPKGHCP